MAVGEAYATKEQLAAFWRPLTEDEMTRADTLLVIASDRLRLIAEANGQDLDAMAEDSAVYTAGLQYTVMEAVRRALETPDGPPVDEFSQTAGPYSQNFKYTNPGSDLWYKKAELQALSLYGNQSLSSIITTREDLYS
jgi:hypothetical protein